MPALKYRGDCKNCGKPILAKCVDTKACSYACGYVLRSKRIREIIVDTQPQVPTLITPIAIKASPVALVPPLTPVGGHTAPSGQSGIRSRTHLIIPDCQVHSGVPIQHLEWVGKYIAQKRPDVIVCIGDFADMPSLCFFNKGKKIAEGQRYVKDIEAVREAMELLVSQWRDIPDYKPRMVLTLGNHEDRITRVAEDNAMLDGTISVHDLAYESFGWEVFPFLQVVKIDGIEYAHYFKGIGAKGFPVLSAKALVSARGGSAIMGHTQHTDVAFHPKTQRIGIFCGTCYLHNEEYLGEQGNVQRRQILMLHEVNDGCFDPMFVSLDYLRRRYSGAA